MTDTGGTGTKASWVLVALGAMLAIGGAFLRVRPQTASATEVRENKARVQALRSRVDQALKARAREMEPKAMEAARVPELAAAIDIGADRRTFEDLFENEEWWTPIRTKFPLSGVVSERGMVAVLGPEPRGVAKAPAVTQARDVGVGSGVAGIAGRPYLIAAARVTRGKRNGDGMVTMVGAPVERPSLEGLVTGPGEALGISDGTRLLEVVGADADRALVDGMVGHEALGTFDLQPDRRGTAWSIEGSLWLLGVVPAAAHAAVVRADLGGIIAGGGLAGIGLLLRLRRRRGPASGSGAGGAAAPGHGMTGQAHNPAGGPGRDLTSSETGSVPPVPVALGTASSYPVPAVPLQTSELAPDDTALAVARQGDSMTLGRYQLLERIGEGGMAEIFIAATHGAEGFVRKFVVKRMHAHLARNRDAVNQFIDEARLQSALVHSNIVPVFDFGKVADDYFLTMEYIHGRDLDWLVRRHVEVFGKPLSVPVAFHIMSEVLEALSYAHSRADADGKVLGIVHRDVAPGNVLISYRGEVKLSDFGIARAERRLSRTEMGLLKGNVSFMSPEQARGEQVDRRSDLFSTGMVLFFCLTGQLRHGHNDTLVNQLLRAASGPIATDMDVLAQFPPLAADVLRRALTRDPARRYQTARDFARDLGGHFTSGRTELADLLDQLFPVGERRAQ